jgi:Sulfotransferase domain
LRVAIISTPRSGNTWLLHLLSKLYHAAPLTFHSPLEIDWKTLPATCIVQLHWHPEPGFLAHLKKAEFRVVVLARHPLDVLISILHFALHDPTARWLEGEGGNERTIYGAMPRSTAFLDYATGPRAKALLSISLEWGSLSGCTTLRYEDLLSQTAIELTRIAQELGVAPDLPVEAAMAETTLPKLRELTKNNNHFWQGQSNLWKNLLTATEATQIARAHSDVLAKNGYCCDPDPELTGSQADANWVNIVWARLTEELHVLKHYKHNVELLEKELAERRQELDYARTELGRMHGAYQGLECVTTNLRRHHSELLAHHNELIDGMTPAAIAMAFRVGRISKRYPQAAAFVKRVIKMAG